MHLYCSVLGSIPEFRAVYILDVVQFRAIDLFHPHAYLGFICLHYFFHILILIFVQESDLRSALLLEQAAQCYLNNFSAMIRKYAFHMILAGHRYNKSAQV